MYRFLELNKLDDDTLDTMYWDAKGELDSILANKGEYSGEQVRTARVELLNIERVIQVRLLP